MAGRPRANIDQVQFENLCRLQCTEREICGWFNITDKTLTRWCKDVYKKPFSQVYAEKREGGKISLRRSQWKLAEHNATMAIFLGKQYLGQKDVQSVEVKKDTDSTIQEMEAYFNDKKRNIGPPVGKTD